MWLLFLSRGRSGACPGSLLLRCLRNTISTARSNDTNKVIDTPCTFLLSSSVYTESHPCRVASFASRTDLRGTAPPTPGYSVRKLVTPTTPTDPTGTSYLFSFQSLAEPYSPSFSNGRPFIPFISLPLRTDFFATGGTPPSIRTGGFLASASAC